MRLLKNVGSEDKARQKMSKNRSIWVICEDFKAFFNAELSSVVVLQRPHYV